MNLATRCTECGTVFRVVQDQLKVSEGWVRCGRCSAVFNAQAELFDLDAPAAGEPSPLASPTSHPAPRIEPDGSATFRSTTSAPTDPDDWSPTMPVTTPPAPPTDDWPAEESVDVNLPIEAAHDADAPGLPPALPPLDGEQEHPSHASDDASSDVILTIGNAETSPDHPPVRIDADEATVTPSFMRAGAGPSFWSRPALRKGLLVVGAVATVALLLQATVAWRDPLAAYVPALRPALVALCDGLACRINPLRRIDRLAVESSGLTRIEGAPLHRLSVTLRNRADTAVLVPAIDLSVTDAQGKLVARRVLQVAELGVTVTTLEAGAELPLQALLNTGDRRVNGYAVELFYP
jgi:predicted Zn finger-like uncharacterized protein